jgi:protein-L-isoaspartate(D-aspartate) O-methyltransferase
MIFPWRPADRVGLAILLSRSGPDFAVKPLMPSWFIPCIGASDIDGCTKAPDTREAWSARSLWLTSDRSPDETAVAIYEHAWFSTAPAAVEA